MKIWFVYIVECSDGSLYTGITTDYKKRIKAHNSGKGAKYTKGKGPVTLKYLVMRLNKSVATSWEIEIKKKSREDKLKMIARWSKDRISLFQLIDILSEQGWTTSGEVDKSIPDNDSTYALWYKDKKVLYVGNYFLESENVGSYGWADPGETKKEVIEFLNKVI